MSAVESTFAKLDTDRRAIRRKAREACDVQRAIIEAAQREIQRINWQAELDERALERAFDPFGRDEQQEAA